MDLSARDRLLRRIGLDSVPNADADGLRIVQHAAHARKQAAG